MGRRKFRLSALPKNSERTSRGQRQVGRPWKKPKRNIAILNSSYSLTSSSDTLSSSPVSSQELCSASPSLHAPGDSLIQVSSVHNFDESLTSSFSTSSGETSISILSSENDVSEMPSSEDEASLLLQVARSKSAPPNFPCPEPSNLCSSSSSLQTIRNGLILPSNWSVQHQGVNSLVVYKISTFPSSPPVITHSVRVAGNLSWNLSVHGFQLDSLKCRLLSSIPETLDRTSLEEMVKLIDKFNVCLGNHDKGYIEMVESKKGHLKSKNKTDITSTIDTFSPVCYGGEQYAKTVRVSSCELLVEGKKCASCVSYRNSLRSMYRRWLKQKSLSPSKRQSTASRTNLRWLSTPEKSKRYSQLRTRLDAKSKKIRRLKEKICVLIEKDHVVLDATLSSDFKAIMIELSKEVHENCTKDSFKQLFWDQQVKATTVKDARQIRWHPAIIKWCLHLKFISSGGYHALRHSGLITLPSERTLRDYTHWLRAGVGFIPEVDVQLVKEANVIAEKDKYVVLSWDEMKIKEDLIFDKQSCSLIGFTNVGNVSDMMDKIEQEERGKLHCNVSSHMLLFMVRGMFSTFEFPYAHFATRGITADSLYPIVWEAVQHLESCGMYVIAFCCDGASPNRKFFKMHGQSSGLVYKTPNPFCPDREIFFISDVPHLLKTTRNCWENSFANKHSRALWKDGKHISWMHLVELYHHNRTESGLSLVPKLHKDHIYLTSYSRMRVNLAAQVLSSSVAQALEYYEDDDTVETRTFVRMFDRFFDCFNARSVSECVQKRKPDLRPYRDPCDSRLTWLAEGFLKYLQDWEDAVNQRKKDIIEVNPENDSDNKIGDSGKKNEKGQGGKEKKYLQSEKKRMLLSAQTREGLRITVQSFLEMVPCLLSVPGVDYILSERLNQDPLESFFGKQRAAGGRSDNPTVQQFCKSTVSLRVQGSTALEPLRGNCGKRSISAENNIANLSVPLPKRPRSSKH